MREWKQVLEFGERWIEGTFFRRARAMGNDIGYDSIVGGGAARDDAALDRQHRPDRRPGKLVLLDMGVEGRNLYTADVTRTLPVDGTLHPAPARPLRPRLHRPAGRHRGRARRGRRSSPRTTPRWTSSPTASRTMGLLPVSAEEALDPESKVYARWTLHGTSHMLGMDVHDCGARLARHLPARATSVEGMVLTVEPGLYFQEDDLLVPEELRGIGIRIEDDILVTADGCRNLSAALPRTSADVEEWMGGAASPACSRARPRSRLPSVGRGPRTPARASCRTGRSACRARAGRPRRSRRRTPPRWRVSSPSAPSAG